MGTWREIRTLAREIGARDLAGMLWPPTMVRFVRWRRARGQ